MRRRIMSSGSRLSPWGTCAYADMSRLPVAARAGSVTAGSITRTDGAQFAPLREIRNCGHGFPPFRFECHGVTGDETTASFPARLMRNQCRRNAQPLKTSARHASRGVLRYFPVPRLLALGQFSALRFTL